MAISALNPNAPMFVPSSYRAVEDFSDQWWDLVRSSPWFRDYWLQECFSDPETFSPFLDAAGDDVVADDFLNNDDLTRGNMDMVSLGWLKWRKPRGEAAAPRYFEKPPKIVNVRVNPRPIHQPR